MGLMSMASHPNFTTNGKFFVAYNCDKFQQPGCEGRCSCNTDVNCDPSKVESFQETSPCQFHLVLVEFTANGTTSSSKLSWKGRVNSVEVRRVFTMGLPFEAYHAGQILFGPAYGYLYFMIGDASHENNPYNFAQNKKPLLGKVTYVKGFATIDNFAAVKDVGSNVIMISQASSEHSLCFAVPEKEVKVVAKALEARFRQALSAGRLSQVAVIPNCSILAAVGQKMASTPGVSATLFNALAKANINVRAIAQGCSEYNITIVVEMEDCVRALRAVHSRFYLSKTSIAVGIIGPGLIGATLLEQLKEQAPVLKEKSNTNLRVMGIMGIMGSRKMLLSDT